MRNMYTRPGIRNKLLHWSAVILLVAGLLLTVGCSTTSIEPKLPVKESSAATKPTEPSTEPETTEPETTEASEETLPETEPTEPTVETESTQADDDAAYASLNSLRQAMIGTPQVFAVAYFGRTESAEPADPFVFMNEQAPQLCQDLPFLLAIPEENIIGEGWGELYCIVPLDTGDSMAVNGVITDDNGEAVYENVLYRSETGDPILLFCNNTDLQPDTQVNIVSGIVPDVIPAWHPQLDDALCVAPLYNSNDEPMIMDFTSYGELLAMG